jgi:PKD repeat protein
MKMKNVLMLTAVTLLTVSIFTSCKKDEAVVITGEALFSFVADGMVVTFTNESDVSGVVTYAWSFGDDGTSTDASPVHTYLVKGEYTVTLTVTDSKGGTHPITTKVKVDKKTRISLTDGSFADWNAVTEPQYVFSAGGDLAGIVKAGKVDYDAKNIYVYLEFEGTLEYGYFFDFYLDTDNDTLTGSRGWIWPTMGANYLIEGQFTVPEALPGVVSFYFNGVTQDEWAWGEDKPFTTGYFTVGHSANIGANAAVELAFDRSKVTDLDNDIVQIAVFLSDPGTWADVGYAPDKAGDSGLAKGLLIDMR